MGDSTDELEFTLEVTHRRNGNRIWGCRNQSTRRIVQGLYYGWGEDVQGFSDLVAGAMQEVVNKLADALDRYEKEHTGMRRAP